MYSNANELSHHFDLHFLALGQNLRGYPIAYLVKPIDQLHDVRRIDITA